jgi:hypothetical protein
MHGDLGRGSTTAALPRATYFHFSPVFQVNSVVFVSSQTPEFWLPVSSSWVIDGTAVGVTLMFADPLPDSFQLVDNIVNLAFRLALTRWGARVRTCNRHAC